MTKAEIQNLRKAVESGEERFLENNETHHAGKLVACSEEKAEVDIYGKKETWPWDECKEIRPDANYMES